MALAVISPELCVVLALFHTTVSRVMGKSDAVMPLQQTYVTDPARSTPDTALTDKEVPNRKDFISNGSVTQHCRGKVEKVSSLLHTLRDIKEEFIAIGVERRKPFVERSHNYEAMHERGEEKRNLTSLEPFVMQATEVRTPAANQHINCVCSESQPVRATAFDPLITVQEQSVCILDLKATVTRSGVVLMLWLICVASPLPFLFCSMSCVLRPIAAKCDEAKLELNWQFYRYTLLLRLCDPQAAFSTSSCTHPPPFCDCKKADA
ncbi:uncharacterized protein V6R79_022384 [Siganus canaliculatus]